MLVDPKFAPATHQDPIMDIVAMVAASNGQSTAMNRVAKGVYIGPLNAEYLFDFRVDYEKKYPEFKDGLGSYGVCDNWQQVIDLYPLDDPNRFFCVTLCEMRRDEQPKDGGWRWHKWGEYIGNRKPTREYLFDEPKIESVFCFHIFELTESQIDERQ